MRIIEKIEIKHFRSFDGGNKQDKVVIDNVADLNVFSGANDSGKSNVLRALNLFFNGEISHGVKFDINRDFSKMVEQRFQKEKEDKKKKAEGNEEKRLSDKKVIIKIHFYNPENQRGLGKKFWISKEFSTRDSFTGEFKYQKKLKPGQVKIFLNSFQFEYVPAIKDRKYFYYLFERLQTHLFEKEDKKGNNKFKQASESLSTTLKTETQNLFTQFLITSGVEASFNIPDTLVDFFRTLSVETENGISLFDRGDGVQARFIPDILDEMSKNSKKNIIWGFEEPENSYESKNIRKLRDDFLTNYSREKQIFITTHTKEFLSIEKKYSEKEKYILEENELITKKKEKKEKIEKLSLKEKSSDISIYRVWKDHKNGNVSRITRFNENNHGWEKTCDDLGIIDESRMIEVLQSKLSKQKKDLEKSGLDIEIQKKIQDDFKNEQKDCLEKLKSAEYRIEEYQKLILYVEDKYSQIYKIAYLKCMDVDCDKDNLEEIFKNSSPFLIRSGNSAGGVSGLLRTKNVDIFENKTIIGLFDFDKEGRENFHNLSNESFWKRDSEEGVRVKDPLGKKETGFYKVRSNCNMFAMLLPIPNRLKDLADLSWDNFASFIEVENLLPENFIKDYSDLKNITGTQYYKFSGNKSIFWEKLFDLPFDDFKDFKPLFEKIKELSENHKGDHKGTPLRGK